MLKILVDECVHSDFISAIEKQRVNIVTVKKAGLVGADDESIFDFAVKNRRILLTFDRGFGDIFRFNISRGFGIVIILVGQMTKEEIINIAACLPSFIKKSDIAGKLVIVGRDKIRILGK